MNYKIITAKGEIFDAAFEVKNNELIIDSTLSGRAFLELINKNYEDLELTDEARRLYNHLWSNEEQFESIVLRVSR
jgi:hypothetical protein